jgi:hypothetical protein
MATKVAPGYRHLINAYADLTAMPTSTIEGGSRPGCCLEVQDVVGIIVEARAIIDSGTSANIRTRTERSEQRVALLDFGT